MVALGVKLSSNATFVFISGLKKEARKLITKNTTINGSLAGRH